ncbi:MAG: hypothetical protein ACOX8S_00590 [Christensenellales bacterium]|jgi:hypothetical protein
MKKFITMLLCAILLLAPALALANSGPVYIHGTPGLEMTVQKNSGISVLHEYLTINIDHYDIALYTADYRMKNSGEAKEVPMAFPLVSRPSDLFEQRPVITCDSKILDYAVYFTKEVKASNSSPPDYKSIGEASFDELLALLDLDLGNKAAAYFASLSGYVYSLDLSQFEGSFDVITEASHGAERILILGHPMNHLSHAADESTSFGVSIDEGGYHGYDVFTFFLSGEKLDIAASIEPYGVGSENKDIIAAPYAFQSQSALTYLLSIFEERFFSYSPALYDALSALYLEHLHDIAPDQKFLLVDDEISWLNYNERLAFLVYTVPFEAGQERNVSVQYSALGTSDYTMNEPQYHYTYISSPAKSWDSFGGLDITLKLPERAPHVIASTVELKPSADNSLIMTAGLDALPEENISFTLSSSQTLTKKVNTYAVFFYGILLVIALVIIAIVVIILLLVRRSRRKKAARSEDGRLA